MPLAYNRRTKQWAKPPLGSQIDWTHPLATGLAGCFLLNENGGSTVFDLVSRITLPILSGTTWSSGLVSNGNALGVLTTCPTAFKVQIPCTIVWQGRSRGTPGSFAYLFGINANTGGATSPFNSFILAFNSGASKVASFTSATSGANFELDIAAIPTSGPAQFAVSWSVGSTGFQAGYLNGVLVTDFSTVPTGTVTYTSTSQIAFGGNATLTSNVAHDFGLLYSVAQSASNLEWLSSEPYAYILPPMSTRYVFMSQASLLGRRTLRDRVGSRGVQ